jgi:SHS2 domain-containing protein
MKYYRLLEHTADIGINVWGDSLEDLFEHAAGAMYSLITDINTVRPLMSLAIDMQASDKDELLRNWLSELLYYFHAKEILLSGFAIESLSETGICSFASGEKFDQSRHVLKHELKAVTFHNLHILQKKPGFQTDIIFDT